MISSGELYDMEEEVLRASPDRLQEMARDLISEAHRLRHLIEEMADFRSSREHGEIMHKLHELRDAVGPKVG